MFKLSAKEKLKVSNSLTLTNEKLTELDGKYRWLRFKSEFRRHFEKSKRDIIKQIERPIDDKVVKARPVDLKKLFQGAKGITQYTGSKITNEHGNQINYKTALANLEHDMNRCIPKWLKDRYESDIKMEKHSRNTSNASHQGKDPPSNKS